MGYLLPHYVTLNILAHFLGWAKVEGSILETMAAIAVVSLLNSYILSEGALCWQNGILEGVLQRGRRKAGPNVTPNGPLGWNATRRRQRLANLSKSHHRISPNPLS